MSSVLIDKEENHFLESDGNVAQSAGNVVRKLKQDNLSALGLVFLKQLIEELLLFEYLL